MANGQPICPKCKCFLRKDGGCTTCERKALLDGKPRYVEDQAEAEKILSEPVEVKDKGSNTVVFTKAKLLSDDAHIYADKTVGDYTRRRRLLLYAIDTVKHGEVSMRMHMGSDGIMHRRYKYRNSYKDDQGRSFKVLVLADEKGDVREVFNFYDD